MRHVSILALHEATMTSIDSSQQLLNRANDFLKYQKKAGFYTVEIVGAEKNIKLNQGLYTISVNKTIDEVKKTDVIIIPLLCGNFSKAIQENKKYCDWVISQYYNGAEIVCLCVGSFFLASTGLLKNKKCAIHWAAKDEFKAMFSDVNLVDDKIITDESGIYTCAGGYSYLNLLLYLIEKHLGKEMSILASKMFEIDIERKSQNPFIIFIGQKKHTDKEVLCAQEFIENSPANIFTVEDICSKFSVGRRTFERRFKKCTGNSIVEYIQRVKVEFAKTQLESDRKSINEIIYEVGYNNIDAFRKVFKRYTDLSPIDYRKRFIRR
ncbi:helix-turn-helix domain-containing protein [Chitinophaga oryziterrae]|uniref:Helix-turn-helix domain-containing protein n=1 Tax=Chitinophaga oryziterrae TaxID=1031224 RepID=A0A6N8J910_9BACT|nr:helix-turn-helix domain-containing protein [Chitinophaga oryziterrae]MVT40709.1 helix-turn-helix domain-containing protein [Chitinophaga oryziterrae]